MPYKNKEKQKECRRKFYLNHKTQEKARSAKARDKQKALLREFVDLVKSISECKCGQNHIATLHFHHRDPSKKEDTIGRIVNKGCSLKTLIKEMNKCDILCANCHAIYHYENAPVSG